MLDPGQNLVGGRGMAKEKKHLDFGANPDPGICFKITERWE